MVLVRYPTSQMEIWADHQKIETSKQWVLVRCPAGDLAGKLLGNEQLGVSNTGRLAWQLDQVFLKFLPDKRPARQLAPDGPSSRYWIHPCAYSMLAWPGGAWGIKKHCFFIGFSRFGRGGRARETKTK